MNASDRYLSNCLYFTSNSLARKLNKLALQSFAPIGMTPSYAFLLLLIYENPGITPSELSLQLDLDPSTVTRLADKMIVRELIVKQAKGKTMHFNGTKKLNQLLPSLESCWFNLRDKYEAILGKEPAKKLVDLTFTVAELL